jgi:DNA repair protein RadC
MSQQNLFTQQVAEIQLTYKNSASKAMPKITCSSDAAEILRNQWDPGLIGFVEEFKVVILNRANKVLGIVQISRGGIAGTVADPKLIFAAALKGCASSVILAHNHPSGNLTPSQADIQLTGKLKEAGKFLDLPVLDHVILTQESHFSFADEGLL